jgi:signal transduction histidine kinase
MQVDLLTTTSITSGLSMIIGIILLLIYWKYRIVQSPLFWGLGYIINAVGFFLYFVAILLSTPFITVISNVFVVVGNNAILAGLWKFKDKKVNWYILIGLLVAMLILTFVFVVIFPNIFLRRISFSLIVFLWSLITARELFKDAPLSLKFAFRINGFFYLFFAAGMALRIIINIINLRNNYLPLFAENLSLLLFIFTNVATACGFILMINARLSDELQKTISAKDTIYSILAHDLRGAIGNIQNFSEIVENKLTLDNKTDVFLKQISKLSHSTLDIMDNLLNWSRMQSGNLRFEPTNTNVFETIDKSINMLRIMASNKGITIENKIPLNIDVFCDANMMETVIRNLITNAIKFTREGGLIQVSAINKENDVAVIVEDNGIGISPEKLDTIFHLQQMERSCGTAKEPGSGLGLKLCKEFVELNNGTIRIFSQPSVGTKVEIHLPLKKT